ncbi:acid phosphatase/Vanadium-dependent haloperoxidase [Ascobolus immersus RN42]|uniref:Acid phosphatase/Vanadium-dependent haloperoxidase n=1 Tax=Ascobolus immersus RN42 TaxID=1160509 RepID=A0A3N4I417_ASCIM|nr:acid phosphatase/Vanadium-dependent haloperoxidase [Ascobolus immersus RN42]
MKFTLAFTTLITLATAQYSGDVVQFWNYRTSYALNASSPRLGSLHESYVGAFVATAVLAAAEDAKRESREVQQLAVSHAAHDALTRIFYAQYQRIDAYFKEIENAVKPSAQQAAAGRRIGEAAAAKVVKARADDGFATYVPYEFQSPAPGVYQPTPPNNPIPATQQAKFVRPFGGIRSLPVWKGPPDVRGREFETALKQIKEKGAKTGSTRTADETEIGYYWLESSITYWNRLASLVVGDSLASDVLKSAQFYAKLNWAIQNAGIIAFVAKNKYDAWRPITALHYKPVFLRSGRSYYTPEWEPLSPTPGHQDYLSGHAVYGSSAAGIIRRQVGSDKFKTPLSVLSTVTQDNVGDVTRTFKSLSQAVKENGDSRVFVGVHFNFASDEGNKAGEVSADLVWKKGTSDYLS